MIATEPNSATAAPGGVSAIGDADFDATVLQSELPVVVDFWAAWCGPCRALAPTYERLSHEYAGRMKFTKVDVEAHPALAARLGLLGVPTLLFFDQGKIVERTTGVNPLRLKDMVDKVLDRHV